ncbi:MAG TPA: FCD domain-containing protein [Roseomonas sp.]|jgi:DNA-binding GntR family transcriptional regulator
MEHGAAAWKDSIVSSLSLLRHEIARRDRFHRALIAACPLPSLPRFCDDLYLQKTRYRRLMETAHQDWVRMLAVHEALAQAVLARSPEAATLLASHIGVTAGMVLALLGETPPGG